MLTECLDQFVVVYDINHLAAGDFIKTCRVDSIFKGDTLNGNVFYSGGGGENSKFKIPLREKIRCNRSVKAYYDSIKNPKSRQGVEANTIMKRVLQHFNKFTYTFSRKSEVRK